MERWRIVEEETSIGAISLKDYDESELADLDGDFNICHMHIKWDECTNFLVTPDHVCEFGIWIEHMQEAYEIAMVYFDTDGNLDNFMWGVAPLNEDQVATQLAKAKAAAEKNLVIDSTTG